MLVRDNSDSNLLTGADVAERLLGVGGSRPCLDRLLNELKNPAGPEWESSLLELKGSYAPSEKFPDDPDYSQPGCFHWNVLHAMIAFANACGGAIVMGIAEKKEDHSIFAGDWDPEHVLKDGKETSALRDRLKKVFFRPNSNGAFCLSFAKSGKNREYSVACSDLMRLKSLVEFYPCHSEICDCDAVVSIVRPLGNSETSPIFVREKVASNDPRQIVYYRDSITPDTIPIIDDLSSVMDYWQKRQPASADFAQMLKRKDSRYLLNEAIRAFYARLEKDAKCRMMEFTPLDASERPFAGESEDAFFSPEVIELGEDDETWLGDDNENESMDAASKDGFEGSESEGEDDCDDANWNGSTYAPLRQGDLLSFLRDEKRIIVSGEPGGGKTTCLQYFALQFARRSNDTNPVLALFIPMGQWRKACSLEQMMSKVSLLSPGQLSQLVAENRLRLVIDAVNECPDNLRSAAIRNICLYLQDRPGLQAVISTRHSEELKELGLPVFQVQPMDEGHQRRYLERYLGDKDQAEELMKQVLSMPGGETIAENPMLLRLVVKVYRESSDHRLPSGRAGLYRKSLRSWYQREKGKFEKAGGGMLWDEKQTLRLLSELAFRGRMKGYRDIPIEIVGEFWGEQVAERIGNLCQGPVVYQEDEFVKFRHETYQEYLCAEFLIAHPDELPEWGLEDYPRWGMVFAYVVELFDSDMQGLPQSFWLAAWKLDPWVGAALTSAATWTQLVRPNFKGTRPMVNGKPLGIRKEGKIQGAPYSFAVSEYVPSCKALRWSLCNRKTTWYHRNNVALRYVVLIDRERTKHWRRFELAQVPQIRGLGLRYAISLAKSWLVIDDPRECFRNSVVDEWNSWVSQANVEDAERLIDCHIALSADFSIAKARWMTGMTLQLAMDLLKKQLLSQDDVRNEIPRWISSATVKEAIDMVSIGVVMIGDFDQRLKEWMESATPKDAFDLVSADFLKQEAFAPMVDRWLEKVTPQSAKWLIKGGWTTQEELNAKMPAWMRDRQGLLM